MFVKVSNSLNSKFHRWPWVGATRGVKKFGSVLGAVFPAVCVKSLGLGGEWGGYKRLKIKFKRT